MLYRFICLRGTIDTLSYEPGMRRSPRNALLAKYVIGNFINSGFNIFNMILGSRMNVYESGAGIAIGSVINIIGRPNDIKSSNVLAFINDASNTTIILYLGSIFLRTDLVHLNLVSWLSLFRIGSVLKSTSLVYLYIILLVYYI